MSRLIELSVVNSESELFSDYFSYIIAPAVGGKIGIMPGHHPLLSLLTAGALTMRLETGEEKICYVGGGIIEIQPYLVTVIAYKALTADKMDEKYIIQEKQDALNLFLHGDKNKKITQEESRLALLEATEQLKVLERVRKVKSYV